MGEIIASMVAEAEDILQRRLLDCYEAPENSYNKIWIPVSAGGRIRPKSCGGIHDNDDDWNRQQSGEVGYRSTVTNPPL